MTESYFSVKQSYLIQIMEIVSYIFVFFNSILLEPFEGATKIFSPIFNVPAKKSFFDNEIFNQ